MKTINTSSTISLADVTRRLNPHIEHMNAQGWELMTVSMENVGINELLILFWKKHIESESEAIGVL